MDTKKYVIDFIEGNVDPKEFIKNCYENNVIFDWIQSIVPENKTCYHNIWVTDKWGDRHIKQEIVPYDIRLIVAQSMRHSGCISDEPSFPMYSHRMIRVFHSVVSSCVKKLLPDDNIVVSMKLQNEFVFLLEACPHYIGGIEVDDSEILEDLMASIPENLSESGRKKWFKTRVRELFHIGGNKYPRWLQEAEWPMSNGKPMRFVSQSRDKNYIYKYVFEDVDTGEIKIVEQFT